MTNVTIKSLAAEVQTPVDRLVQTFTDIGINKTVSDIVTQQEKEILLEYLNRDRKKKVHVKTLTLQRKTRSTLNIPSTGGGKSKSVPIEIRKKRIYLQHYSKPFESIDDEVGHLVVKNTTSENNEQYVIEDKKDQCQSITSSTTKKTKNFPESVKNKKCKWVNNKSDLRKTVKEAEKAFRAAKTAELKYKAEEEMRRKIEAEAQKVAETVRRMAEENSENWEKTLDEEDTNDYHVTTSYHAREAEDEHDRKVENKRRSRSRIGKGTKPKKTGRLSGFKADREEARVAARNSSNKRQSTSTLTQEFNKPLHIINRDVVLGETITIAELANKMAVKSSQVIKTMMKLGAMVTINQFINQETAQLVAETMGHKVILHRENELEESLIRERNIGNCSVIELRAPIVTIMGHVDHGKTSLLDYIRSTKIADSEAGGITQHIGAYHVETHRGMITFLDTPGHTAFAAMRARGVKVTDIVVLVVAADDGVMPQTIEAIQHAKAAQVPIVVAINKIDSPGSDPDRVKKELIQYGVIPENWGGDSQFVNISAKNGIGIDLLLDAILLQAEILELKVIRSGMASGIVIESFLDKGRGPVVTILVREGTLNRGDVLLCGSEYGRVRAMYDDMGHDITLAGPSIPVEVLGLSGLPASGDAATVVRDEKKAREVALYRQGKFREVKLASSQKKPLLENIFSNKHEEKKPSELNIVLKSDLHSSSEAIRYALENLSTDKVNVKIMGSGIGGITETDVMLAVASNAILLAFNVRIDASSRRLIEKNGIDFRYYSVIYHLIDEIKQEMSGILLPENKQEIIGLARVRSVFRSTKFGTIAGCIVTEGIVKRYNRIRVLRDKIVVYEGDLESLRHFKDDISEVRNGMECGIGVKNYNNFCIGDVIEVLETVIIKGIIT